MKRHLHGLMILWVLPALGQPVLLQEGLDSTGIFPAGWRTHYWSTTAQTPSPGSGGFSFALRGRQADRLCTPVLDARAATLDSLSYLARRTGSYPTLHLIVRASTDGGRTFPYVLAAAGEALPEPDGSWQLMSFAVPPALSGASWLQLCFDALGGTSSSARLQLDDITLYGKGRLHHRPLAVWPPYVDAGFAAVGDTVEFTLLLRNQTDTTLVLSLPMPPFPWWIEQTAAVLPPRQSDTLRLFVAPTAPDTFAATWAFSVVQDTLAVSMVVTAAPPTHYLGWHQTSTSVRAQDTVQLGLQLRVPNASLQGLFVTVRLPQKGWAHASLKPGVSLPNPSRWILQQARHGDKLHVLLLGESSYPLPRGTYPDLLRLQLVPDDVSDTTVYTLTLAELEATAATPDAPLVTLALHPRRLQLMVHPRTAYAVLFPDTLRLPPTSVGTYRSATAYLANPGGERALHVRVYPPSDPTLTIQPDSFDVAPDDTVRLTLTFRPTLRNFGYRTATIRFRHDGLEADTLLIVEAIGVGGLGDATEEGAVDVADLQRGIRYVLGLETPEAQDRLVLDVAPFPYGDGQLHLNDLSVLVQAITRNTWPDNHPLPTPPPTTPSYAGKQRSPIVLQLAPATSDHIRMEIEAPHPFGALQLVLPPIPFDTSQLTVPPEAYFRVEATADRLTLLLYRLDGFSFLPGRYAIGLLSSARVDTLRPLRWIAVDETGRYLPTAIRIAQSTEVQTIPQAPFFRPPYPQPFLTSQHTALVLSGTLPAPDLFTLEVFDLLGRRLLFMQKPLPAGPFRYRWQVRDAQGQLLAPGLYLLRLQASQTIRIFPLIVLR